eukprot:6201625-Pleurochrysis_carterae.AAC.1
MLVTYIVGHRVVTRVVDHSFGFEFKHARNPHGQASRFAARNVGSPFGFVNRMVVHHAVYHSKA